MFQRIANWMFASAETDLQPVHTPQAAEEKALTHAEELKRVREQFSYPPREKGISFESPSLLVETHSSLINQLRRFAAVGKDFDPLFLDAIQRYAAVVHLLPASESHHHRLMGGLLHHGIHAGLIAFRLSEDVDFSSNHSSLELRRVQEPKYRFACFLAALCHDLGKVVSDIEVHNHDATLRWNAYSETLTAWGDRHALDKYFISWLPTRKNNRHIRFNSSIAPLVISPHAMAYLSEYGPEIQAELMAALNGDATSAIYRISSKADSLSVAEDLRTHRIMTGHMSVGISLAEHIVSKLSQLIRSNDISLKPADGLVFNISDQIYLAWPIVAEKIIASLKNDGISGIPSRPEVIADVLLEHGLADKPESKGRYFYVSEANKNRATKEISTLKLSDPETVFTSALPPQSPKEHHVFDMPATSRRMAEQLRAQGVPEAPEQTDSIEEPELKNTPETESTNQEQAEQQDKASAPEPKPKSSPASNKPAPAAPKGPKVKGLKKLGEHGQLVFMTIQALIDANEKPLLDNGIVYIPWDTLVEASGLEKQECKETLVSANGFLKQQVEGNPNSIFRIINGRKYVGMSKTAEASLMLDFPRLSPGVPQNAPEEKASNNKTDAKKVSESEQPQPTKEGESKPSTKMKAKKSPKRSKANDNDQAPTEDLKPPPAEDPVDKFANEIQPIENAEGRDALKQALESLGIEIGPKNYVLLDNDQNSQLLNVIKKSHLKSNPKLFKSILLASNNWKTKVVWRVS